MIDDQGRHVCPRCGKRYKLTGFYGRHVRKAHRIEPTTGRPLAPPHVVLTIGAETFVLRFWHGQHLVRADKWDTETDASQWHPSAFYVDCKQRRMTIAVEADSDRLADVLLAGISVALKQQGHTLADLYT